LDPKLVNQARLARAVGSNHIAKATQHHWHPPVLVFLSSEGGFCIGSMSP